jgi:hypothetical protein
MDIMKLLPAKKSQASDTRRSEKPQQQPDKAHKMSFNDIMRLITKPAVVDHRGNSKNRAADARN